MAYRVKAPAVVVKIGGGERYLYKGTIVPAAATNADHLLTIGLIEDIELLTATEADDTVEEEQMLGEQPVEDEAAGAEPELSEEPPEPPAKAGPGSSAEAWRNYASALGIDVPADVGRDDVIDLLETAGKPTE